MKKIIIFAITFITFFLFSGCTSDNSEKFLMCEKIAFDVSEDGNFSATAIYKSESSDTDFTEKSFLAKDFPLLIEQMLSAEKNAIYTPVKYIFISTKIQQNALFSLLNSVMNSTKINLKCRVFESEDTKSALYTEPYEQNGTSFTEYYRTKTNFTKTETAYE